MPTPHASAVPSPAASPATSPAGLARPHRIVPVVRRHALALSQALGWPGEAA